MSKSADHGLSSSSITYMKNSNNSNTNSTNMTSSSKDVVSLTLCLFSSLKVQLKKLFRLCDFNDVIEVTTEYLLLCHTESSKLPEKTFPRAQVQREKEYDINKEKKMIVVIMKKGMRNRLRF